MRIALIIVLGASYYLGWLPASLVVPALLAVSMLRMAGPTRRPGGSDHQLSGASNGASPTTAERVATYTSSLPTPGEPWVDQIPLTRLADLSRTTAHSSSTQIAAVTNPGVPMTVAVEPPTRPHGDCGCNDAA